MKNIAINLLIVLVFAYLVFDSLWKAQFHESELQEPAWLSSEP